MLKEAIFIGIAIIDGYNPQKGPLMKKLLLLTLCAVSMPVQLSAVIFFREDLKAKIEEAGGDKEQTSCVYKIVLEIGEVAGNEALPGFTNNPWSSYTDEQIRQSCEVQNRAMEIATDEWCALMEANKSKLNN